MPRYYVWDPNDHESFEDGYLSSDYLPSPEHAAQEAADACWSEWELWECSSPMRFAVCPADGGDVVMVDVYVDFTPTFDAHRAAKCKVCTALALPGTKRCQGCFDAWFPESHNG